MPEDNKLPDPQAGGRYERNADGTLKTIHQTKPIDTAEYTARKAERMARGDAGGAQPAAPAAGTDNDQE